MLGVKECACLSVVVVVYRVERMPEYSEQKMCFWDSSSGDESAGGPVPARQDQRDPKTDPITEGTMGPVQSDTLQMAFVYRDVSDEMIVPDYTGSTAVPAILDIPMALFMNWFRFRSDT